MLLTNWQVKGVHCEFAKKILNDQLRSDIRPYWGIPEYWFCKLQTSCYWPTISIRIIISRSTVSYTNKYNQLCGWATLCFLIHYTTHKETLFLIMLNTYNFHSHSKDMGE